MRGLGGKEYREREEKVKTQRDTRSLNEVRQQGEVSHVEQVLSTRDWS